MIYFLSDFNNSNYARKLGSKDKQKRKRLRNTIGLATKTLAAGALAGLAVKYGSQIAQKQYAFDKYVKKDLPNLYPNATEKFKDKMIKTHIDYLNGIGGNKLRRNSNIAGGAALGATIGIGVNKYRKNKDNQYR